MVIKPSTETVLVDGNEEPAIVIKAETDNDTSIQRFVEALIESFVLQKMVSSPEISILAIRINGDLNRDEFVEEWRRQLLEDTPMSEAANAFINNIMRTVDAMHYPAHGASVTIDLT